MPRSNSAAKAAAPHQPCAERSSHSKPDHSAAGDPGGGPIDARLDPLMRLVVAECRRRGIGPGELYRLMRPSPPCGRQHVYSIFSGARTPTTPIVAAILEALGARITFDR